MGRLTGTRRVAGDVAEAADEELLIRLARGMFECETCTTYRVWSSNMKQRYSDIHGIRQLR